MKYLVIVFSLFLITTTHAKQSSTVLKWGLNVDPLHYFVPAANQFKKNVELKTNGRVKVKLFINQYPQDTRDHVKDVRSGLYDMGQETVIKLQKIDPSLSFWELPFLFRSNAQVFKFTSSKYAKNTFKFLKNKGVTGVEYTYSGGFLYFFGNRLDSLSRLEGKVVGVDDSTEDYKKTLTNTLGSISKVYTGDKAPYKLNEVISSASDELLNMPIDLREYINVTEHRVFARVIFLSDAFLAKLSVEDKKIVLQEAKDAAIFERNLAVKTTTEFLEALEKNGSKINHWTEEMKDRDQKLFDKAYEQYKKKYGDQLIEYIKTLK